MKSSRIILESEEKKTSAKQDLELKQIQDVFADAKREFQAETRVPYKKSKLGKRFGFFACIKHTNADTIVIGRKLSESTTALEAKEVCHHYLLMNSNLFISKRASNHSFSNYLIKHFKIAAPDTWKAIEDRLLHPVKYAVVSARVKFHSDTWKLDDVSSIGCKFTAKDDKVREEKSAEKFTKAETIEDCTALLKIEGSLWDPITVSVNTHSFTNYMLTCLFDENIDAYEMIVGKAYGLAFVPRDKSIVIYRRDNRPPEEIKEADGFQLKEALNPPDGRKDKYGAVYTDSSGISFALTPPSGHFGVNLYTVILPAKRKIPLINIADSPRNKDHPERSKLHEVNSLRPIPFGFLWSCAMTFHTWMNMEFSRDPDLGTQNIKRRGCF